MSESKKIIGTLLPLSSLSKSKKNSQAFKKGLEFIDWLIKTNQSAWQLLPLHQTHLEPNSSTKRVPSPYKGYGVGLNELFLSKSLNVALTKNKLNSFIKKNNYWLKDYSRFVTLTNLFKTDDWTKWDSDFKRNDKYALTSFEKKYKKNISSCIIDQYKLSYQFNLLRKKAKENNIILIGDLPFYLPFKSPLVWAFQRLFHLTKNSKMKYVSGLPDGPKAHYGRQVWGHPLYKWQDKTLINPINNLFKLRLKYLSNLYDYIRFDHAKGFFNYGSIDLKEEREDKLILGPGVKAFSKIINYTNSLNIKIFAEDSGDKLKQLKATLSDKKIPGVRIFRFALTIKNKPKIHNTYAKIKSYPFNTIAYTTMHDTETLLGYLNKLSIVQIKKLAKINNITYQKNSKNMARRFRQAVINSPSKIIIIPIQDWLLSTNRINIPGTEKKYNDPNWNYHLKTPIKNLPTNLFS